MARTLHDGAGLVPPFVLLPALALAATLAASPARAQSLDDLRQLSLEDLSHVQVTSVSRRPESLSEAPGAIYVITAEDIRRSGAATLPEILRLAPNLEVAQQDAETYSISARGFNSAAAANKLLVLVDGRAVYAPVHSGVYWDQFQPVLEDIERIEVVSGPGGALWGANAVNGVINIITKSSRDTQGGLLSLKAGTVNQNGVLQYGGKLGDGATYRAYGTGFGVGHTDLPGGASAHDDWTGGQAGFRGDWQVTTDDSAMLSGDYYRNQNPLDGRNTGLDILSRWEHRFGDGSNLQVQSSYDQEQRLALGSSDTYGSYDLQAQHTITLGRHLVVWGGEYRLITDSFVNSINTFQLLPAHRTIGVGDIFAQDTYAITDALKLTVGTKIEQSSYSGIDYLPSVRLGWRATGTTFFWAAISRAVRTPSRIDRDLAAPVILAPAVDFRSEKLLAYEIGYRGRPTAQTALSVSFYYNVYDDLRTTGLSNVNGYIFELQNGERGSTYGVEAWGDWRVFPWWKLTAGVNLIRKNLHLKPGYVDIALGVSEGNDPGYQLSLRSAMDLPHDVELDFTVRSVDGLSTPSLPAYTEATARVAWHVTPRVELSLTGNNLFTSRHPEIPVSSTQVFEARRSIYLGARIGF